ncbi:hypothetical protein CMESO_557 (nucleomorph) [Chroomonas mesostigmatica CCMP1168]|uniref:Uncharacterized protein n=1 Tax=Chroomonas mesostigmatica CCMP1168 TaxID=1195612 RepID=J7G2J7_9CRYP|nr:hypothetical protein CMESO_557 [Chroomonas mesostigmatica CCMP1168]
MFWEEENFYSTEKYKLVRISNKIESTIGLIKKNNFSKLKKILLKDKNWFLYFKKKKKKDTYIFFFKYLCIGNNFFYCSQKNFFSLGFYYSVSNFEFPKLSTEIFLLNNCINDFQLNENFLHYFKLFIYNNKNYIRKSTEWCCVYKNFIFFLQKNIETLSVIKKPENEKFHFQEKLKLFLNTNYNFSKNYKKKCEKKKYSFSDLSILFFFSELFFRNSKIQENKIVEFTKEILCKMSLCNFNTSIFKILQYNYIKSLKIILISDFFEKAKYDSTRLEVYSKIYFIKLKYKLLKKSKEFMVLLFYNRNKLKNEMQKFKNSEISFWSESHFNFLRKEIWEINTRYSFLLKKKEENFSEIKFFFFLIKKMFKDKLGKTKRHFKCFGDGRHFRVVLGILSFFFMGNKNFLKNWMVRIIIEYFKFFTKKKIYFFFHFFATKKKMNAIAYKFCKKIQRKTFLIFFNFRNKRIYFALFETIGRVENFLKHSSSF